MLNTATTEINNKQKTLSFVFSPRELEIQFTEIFVEKQYEKAIVKENMVILDVGANIGLSAIYFQPHAKQIYALEPEPNTYKALIENTKDYGNIKCFNVGLSDSNRKQMIYGHKGSIPDTVIKYDRAGRDDCTSETIIDLVTIEKFMTDNNIDHVDVLKVDTEGSEYPLFISDEFERVASKIDYIIGESHFVPPFSPQFLPVILKSVGFNSRFMKYKNLYEVIEVSMPNSRVKKYTAFQKTMFFAKRK